MITERINIEWKISKTIIEVGGFKKKKKETENIQGIKGKSWKLKIR